MSFFIIPSWYLLIARERSAGLGVEMEAIWSEQQDDDAAVGCPSYAFLVGSLYLYFTTPIS